MPNEYHLVLSTCPDQTIATNIANALVEQRLAACVNILPGVTSVYQWQGNIESDTECLILIKSKPDIFEELNKCITELHPYELPEIIAVPVINGLAKYLAWIDDSVITSLE